MMLISLIFSSLIVIVIGDCESCSEGHCQSRITLLENVDITDHLAIDWLNNILYVQLNSVINIALYIKNYAIAKAHVVQIFETSGMTVRQSTQDLYTADFRSNIYRIPKGTNEVEVESNGVLDGIVNKMYYSNRLYLTKKKEENLFHFNEASLIPAKDLSDYLISDFVKTEKGVYFVANNTVYEYTRPFSGPPKVLAPKKMLLSIDQFDNIYLGSEVDKILYKKSNVSQKLYVFSAYKTGNINAFVFDRDNNIIVHDSKEKKLVIWKREMTTCSINLPHCSVQINVNKILATPANEDNEEVDVEDHSENVNDELFWKLYDKTRK